MGLLRKAAGAGLPGRGEARARKPGALGTGSGSAEGPRRGPGLMARSLKAREAAAEALPVEESIPASEVLEPPEEIEAAASMLSIELAGQGSVEVPMPVRVEAEPQPALPGPAAAQAEAVPGKTVESLTEELLTAISTLRPGMELPSRLFTALTGLLGVRKGAFLLYDPVRLVYAPWAVRGYDQTTLRRMRIPLGANEAWNALANGRPLVVAPPALAQFQQFFSSREFAAVGKLILAPFIAEDKLAAVFLVTDLESPLAADGDLLECLARAAEAGAPRVQEARAARVAAAVSSGSRPEAVSAQDETGRFLEAVGAARSPVVLASLSLEDFSRGVLLSHHDLEPFRLHEDLVFFLGSFVADVGKAMALRPGRFVLALPQFDPSALDVFAHQLSRFLHGLLGDGDGHDPALAAKILKVRTWPSDGSDLRALVESLSSA